MVCVAEMLPGRRGGKIGYDELSQYIEGWLQYKENKRYERFWFVLRGDILNGTDLVTAYLFCFKDLNIHVEENAVGSIEINSDDKVEFLKCTGNKPMKCDFTIMLSETKFHFRADDEISRERWIYALCELIGKSLPPSELPTERNQIRASFTSLNKKNEKKVGPFHRSKTVELPSLAGIARARNVRSTSSVQRSFAGTTPGSMRSLSDVTAPRINEGPLIPPPRSSHSLPFMLDPSVSDIKNIPWFYPGMRRDEAQERLEKCPAGYYLLRDSESKAGSYTLAFKDVDRIKNYMITQSSDQQYKFTRSEVESSFPSPQKAVEFYMIKKHSKTLTPVPYIVKRRGLLDSEDRDYLLESEMNQKSPPNRQDHFKTVQPLSYIHRELPPTPTEVTALRSLSIQDDDEGYLKVENETDETKRYTVKTLSKQERVELDEKENEVNLGNDYTRSPSLMYGKEFALDESESYLMIANPEDVVGCTRESGSDSASDDNARDYLEYDENQVSSRHLNERLKYDNSIPAKVGSFKKGTSFSHYDDNLSGQSYENQIVIDGAVSSAPPIPPRSSKPELPSRREPSFPT